MYPNFHDKQYVLTNIVALRFHDLKLGDVVVFKAPPDPEKDYIKRVIGTPGDKILIKNGRVYVNGTKLDESPYLKPNVETYGGSFLKEAEEVTVSTENYFVMGDNRPFSSDSREWGFVPKKSLIGESFFIYWPLNTLGFVKNPHNQ